jgi:hypothetical protein
VVNENFAQRKRSQKEERKELPKSKTVNTKIIKRSGGNDTSESEKDTAELMPLH